MKRTNRWKSWTNEDDDVIENGIAEGLTYRQIAEKLGDRTEAAVSQRCRVMRDKYSRYQTRRKERLDFTADEIRSVADDNRIWIAMVNASVAAVCSAVILLICIGGMFL